MRILLDIGHPAHVHYFKHVIQGLNRTGCQVIVVARAKEITFELLKAYNIPFFSRGRGKNNLLGKFFYLFYGTLRIIKIAKKNKIDFFISFASPYNALASVFYRKPNITFDDTEHNIFNHRLYVPLSDVILTPESFKKDFGDKHIRFKGTMDSAYLHPAYFKHKDVQFANTSNPDKKTIILRFVSWNATHDINQKGFSVDQIRKLIEKLRGMACIFVSSEKALPDDLHKYNLKIAPEEMHHYLAKADLLIGESGSMATEAAYLGTHSIVLNPAAHDFGVFDWFSKYKVFYIADNYEDVISNATKLLTRDDLKSEAKVEADKIKNDSICLADLIIWFINNYPASTDILKNKPEYQITFQNC